MGTTLVLVERYQQKQKLLKAVRQTTAVKAPGVENLSPEAVRSDKETSVKLLHLSLVDIWEEIPDE
jgi:hypothetical protein